MTELLSDILDEPGALSGTLTYTLGPGRAALQEAADLVRAAGAITITGIGSSWHAGMALQSLFQACGRPISLTDASELLHFAEITPNSALIVLSRSGKSVEIVRLIEKARHAGAKIVAITNTPDSPLARSADVTLRLEAPFDHNVSVTMYSGLALVGGLLAAAVLGSLDAALEDTLADALVALPSSLPEWRRQIEGSDWFAADAPTYLLARGGSLASAHEARLLWEEAAKAPATALTTGGFRHGPQEVVRPEVRIGLWLDAVRLRDEDLTLARDLHAAGVKTLLIGQNVPQDAGNLVFRLPKTPAAWQFLIDIVPVQLAAEYVSRLRGENCDAFRFCPYIVEGEGGLSG
jgi:glucosamine--fructose-6-phosphate aminotransferase (isomerizing)